MMTAPNLKTFLTTIWAEIGDFTHPRCGFPGLATLATQSDEGPQIRQLVLRSADKTASRVILHSDTETAKCREIAENGAVSLLLWRPETKLQLRLKGRAEILGNYAAAEVWSDLPFASRGNYGVTPHPGTPIENADAYERIADQKRLAVITVHLHQIDAVQLSEPHHIRAKFEKSNDWTGQWLAP